MKKLFKCDKNSYKVYEQEFDKISHIVTVLFAMDDMDD